MKKNKKNCANIFFNGEIVLTVAVLFFIYIKIYSRIYFIVSLFHNGVLFKWLTNNS